MPVERAVGQWDKLSTHVPTSMLFINLGGMDLLVMSKTRVMDFMLVRMEGVREEVLEAKPGHAIITKHAL